MKRLTLLTIVVFALAACEVVIVEPYDPRDNIVGSWQIEEYSETWHESYVFPISIYKSGHDSEAVRIVNFYDVDITVIGYLHGNRLEIPFQVVDYYEVSGVGTVHGDHIEFSYSVFDQVSGGYIDYCNATAF